MDKGFFVRSAADEARIIFIVAMVFLVILLANFLLCMEIRSTHAERYELKRMSNDMRHIRLTLDEQDRLISALFEPDKEARK